MDLRLLEAIVAVADERHFRRAAERLGMTQPPLSARIQRAEAELGVQVFERDRSGVYVTDAGRVVVERARGILAGAAALAEVAAGLRRGVAGTVRIAAVGSAFYAALPRLLEHVRAELPEVELAVAELETPALVDSIRRGDHDLGFVRPPVGFGLQARTVWAEPLVAAVHKSHPRADDGQIDLAELVRERVLFFPRESGPGYWDRVAGLFAQADAPLQPNAVTDHVTSLLGLVAMRLGVTVVPATARHLALPGVRYLAITPTAQLPLAVVSSSDHPRAAVAAVLARIPETVLTPEG